MLRRLLWADDQPEFIAAARTAINDLAEEIRTVSSGDAAFAVITEWSPDLVILDLKMPPGDWGGISCLEKLGDRTKRVPILVLSGIGMVSQCVKAMELGALVFVEKDRVEFDLRDGIDRALKKFRATLPLDDYDRVRAIERQLHEAVIRILRCEADRIGASSLFVRELVPREVAVGAYTRWFEEGRGKQEDYLFLIDLRSILDALRSVDLVQALDGVVRPSRREDRTRWIADLNDIRKPLAHPIREPLSQQDRDKLDRIEDIVSRWSKIVHERCATASDAE